VDGHATWVSTPVLELMVAGGKIPKDVDGGEIIRDRDGIPTGIALESGLSLSWLTLATGIFVDNAMDLVPIPEKTPAQVSEYIKTTIRDALEVGLTNIHDADGVDKYIDFYKE
jgi:predicted amidohydrolase YtcJ